MLVGFFLLPTGLRVRPAPGIPCALLLSRDTELQSSDAKSRRGDAGSCFQLSSRASERFRLSAVARKAKAEARPGDDSGKEARTHKQNAAEWSAAFFKIKERKSVTPRPPSSRRSSSAWR